MRFVKKPVEIEAVQWDGDNWVEVREFTGDRAERRSDPRIGTLHIQTLEGVMEARRGDWIIRGVQGEYYPCKPDIFEATYDKVIDA